MYCDIRENMTEPCDWLIDILCIFNHMLFSMRRRTWGSSKIDVSSRLTRDSVLPMRSTIRTVSGLRNMEAVIGHSSDKS